MTTAPLGREDASVRWAARAAPGWSALRAHWQAAAFAAITLVAAAFAFVAFGVTDLWTDELFTLFVIDHDGGPAEILRRALTDTHPPGYYLLLYAWTQLAGLSEWAVRLPSAVCAVGALGVTAWALRRVYPAASVAFALAVAATSMFWFFQAQNARSYSLCMLLSAVLLAAAVEVRRRSRAGERPGLGPLAWIVGAGLLAAFTHFYMLLTVGMVIGFLILTTPSWPFRIALALGGLLILGADLAYMSTLLGETQQNVQEMWFRNDVAHLLGAIRGAFRSGVGSMSQYAVLILAAVAVLGPLSAPTPAKAPGDDRRWTTWMAIFVCAGVYLAGVAVSVLFAPSISDQNLLAAAPFGWVLLAALHRRAFAQLRPGVRDSVAAAIVVLVGSQLLLLGGRFEQRNEAWRDSAEYIGEIPACQGQAIPVVRPFLFGPETPFFASLTRDYFYARYFPGAPSQLQVVSPRAYLSPEDDPAFIETLAERGRDESACPVLAWAVHDVTLDDARRLQRGLERLPAMEGVRVRLRTFTHKRRQRLSWVDRPSAYVLEVTRPITPETGVGRR